MSKFGKSLLAEAKREAKHAFRYYNIRRSYEYLSQAEQDVRKYEIETQRVRKQKKIKEAK